MKSLNGDQNSFQSHWDKLLADPITPTDVALLARTLEHAPHPFAVGTNDGQILACNNAYCELTGYTKAELAQLDWTLDLTPVQWRAPEGQVLQHCLGNGPRQYEKELLRKDGATIPVGLWIQSVPWPEGAGVIYYGFVEDLTLQKQASDNYWNHPERFQSLLSPLTNQLRQFFHLSRDIFLIIDYHSYIKEANPAFTTTLGYSLKDLATIPLADLIHPDDLPDAITCGRQAVNGLLNSLDLVIRIRCKDGSYRWLDLRADMAPSEGVIYAVGRDITEHRQLQLELQISKIRLQSILENISDSFYSLDTNWRFAYINYNTEKAMGQSRENLLGRNIWEVFPHAVGTPTYDKYHQAMAEQTPLHFEAPGINYPGRILEFRLHPSPVGLSVFWKDVTEAHRTKRELENYSRIKLLGEMAATFAHEIRNPLTSVKGFLQLIQRRNPEENPYYQLMIEELDRANGIITEYLALAPNKSGAFETQDLNDIINALRPLLSAEAVAHHHTLAVDLAQLPHLPLNQSEIRQLLLNLARNGFESMAPGGTLRISTSVADGSVHLAIIDQGSGIPPQDQEQIGSPFFTTKDTGTGLGLATCFSIVARHSATMTFETGPSGTTFLVTFKIPLEK